MKLNWQRHVGSDGCGVYWLAETPFDTAYEVNRDSEPEDGTDELSLARQAAAERWRAIYLAREDCLLAEGCSLDGAKAMCEADFARRMRGIAA